MEEQYLIGTALSQLGADIQKAAKEEALTSYRGVKGKQLEGRSSSSGGRAANRPG